MASALLDAVKIHLDLRPVKIHRKFPMRGARSAYGRPAGCLIEPAERPPAPPTEPVELRPVTRSDRAVLENLGQLYRHRRCGRGPGTWITLQT
jgi:hypothetical protein